MGKDSSIEWTDHTFNPWWGCQHVSPGCENCYAETFSERLGHGKRLPMIWGGKSTSRRFFGDHHWREPLQWNAAAFRDGVSRFVFCASMADVFEDRPELVSPRARLHNLIISTPALTWLLLTKRPQNAERLMMLSTPGAHDSGYGIAPPVWPTNVILGTTIENQAGADERIPILQRIGARRRFLSCEPLLGLVRLRSLDAIDWVICGGESGPGARPMHPAWARQLRDQTIARGIPFLFKQWGSWAPVGFCADSAEPKLDRERERWMNVAGGHGFHGEDVWRMRRGDKRIAGRVLGCRTWDERPSETVASLLATLLPCPLCGGDAEKYVWQPRSVAIQCLQCGAIQKKAEQALDDDRPMAALERAVWSWNRRDPVNPGPGKVVTP